MPQAALGKGVAGMIQAQAVAPDHAKHRLLPFPLLPLEMELGEHVGLGDTLDGELELAVGPFRTGFRIECRKGYREALPRVAAGVLAGDTVEPALTPTRDREVLRRDGEHPALHQNALIKPFGKSEAHALALAGSLVNQVFPGLNPAELSELFLAPGPDVGPDDGGLKAGECPFQKLVISSSRVAVDRPQKIIRVEMEGAGDIVQPAILHVDDDGNCPDENVRVPDRGHAEILVRLYLHPYRTVRAFIVDRSEPLALGQAEKGPLHRLALIAQGKIDDRMDE